MLVYFQEKIMENSHLKDLTIAALIGAMYVVLTLLIAPISYGPLQFRVAEALTVLPYLFPQAIIGLFIGCLISNINSPFGLIDILLGSLSTLVAAYLTYKAPKPILAPLPPILINAIVVSAYISYIIKVPYYLTALYIMISQTIICYGLGYPLLILLLKRKGFQQQLFP